MKLTEIYKLCLETDMSQEKVWSILDENITMLKPSISQLLETIQSTLDKCVCDSGDYKFLDEAMATITLRVAKAYLLTDLDPGDDGDYEDEKLKGKNSYDLMIALGIDDYIYDRNSKYAIEFENITSDTAYTFREKYSTGAILDKYMSSIALLFDGLAGKAGALLDSIEKFDPNQLKDVEKTLVHMNESVQKVKELNEKK